MKRIIGGQTITIWMAAATVLLLLLSGAGAYIYHLRDKNKQLYQVGQARGWEVVKWRNAHGNSQARIKTLQADYKNLEGTYQDWVDSLSKQLNIRPKHVQSAVSVGIRNERTVRFEKSAEDTVGVYTFADKHHHFSARLSPDFLEFTPTTFDSLGIVSHLRREPGVWNFLTGRRTLHTDVVSYNPYSTFTGLRSYRKPVSGQRLGLTLFAGYDPFLNRGSVGVGVGWIIWPF